MRRQPVEIEGLAEKISIYLFLRAGVLGEACTSKDRADPLFTFRLNPLGPPLGTILILVRLFIPGKHVSLTSPVSISLP